MSPILITIQFKKITLRQFQFNRIRSSNPRHIAFSTCNFPSRCATWRPGGQQPQWGRRHRGGRAAAAWTLWSRTPSAADPPLPWTAGPQPSPWTAAGWRRRVGRTPATGYLRENITKLQKNVLKKIASWKILRFFKLKVLSKPRVRPTVSLKKPVLLKTFRGQHGLI